MTTPKICPTVSAFRAELAALRKEGARIGLVPTMGALHEGHLALVRRAKEICDRVVVSAFVNPTQFGPGEDYSTYPRDEAADTAKLREIGVHAVFAPSVEEMYPPGFSTSVKVKGLTEGLCGAFRPVHFEGVTTVVTKLLLQVLPDVAVFGEKDYQQLQVIRRLVRDLDIPVAIEGVPTVREADGLALSSRNAYLSPGERAAAPMLPLRLFRERSFAAANAETVGCRSPGSRASPFMTAASSSFAKRCPGTASLRGVGDSVSSCWNSSRGEWPL